MRWITRKNASVDRIACPWLIRRFVDPDAEFLYVPADEVRAEGLDLDGDRAVGPLRRKQAFGAEVDEAPFRLV
jgi:hypothetical protein